MLDDLEKYKQAVTVLNTKFNAYQMAFLTYAQQLKVYISYIGEIRKMDVTDTILEIEKCIKDINEVQQKNILQIKTIIDEKLVSAVKEYAHTETMLLYYCYKNSKPVPSIFFTTRDMCHVCENAVSKLLGKGADDTIVVSVKEHDDSWKRHEATSKVKKVVIDTDVKFNTLISATTEECKKQAIIDDYLKLYSVRGFCLLCQDLEAIKIFESLVAISTDNFELACGNSTKKIRRDLLTAYFVDSKISTLSMLVRIYQGVFSKKYLGQKKDIITGIKNTVSGQLSLHMNQDLLKNYLDYIFGKLPVIE